MRKGLTRLRRNIQLFKASTGKTVKKTAGFIRKVFNGFIYAGLIVLIPMYSGFGSFYLTVKVLRYPEVKAMLYTLVITSAVAGWITVLTVKRIQDKYGEQ